MGIPVSSTHASLASSSQGFYSSLMLAVPCQQLLVSSLVKLYLCTLMLVLLLASCGISVNNHLVVSLHYVGGLYHQWVPNPCQLFLGNPRPRIVS
jgi:hypothetical protein